MKYLIWSTEHRGWWKPNRHGYTTRTDLAGRFSSEEARNIIANANRPLTGATLEAPPELMVEAPSRDQIKLDLEYPDR